MRVLKNARHERFAQFVAAGKTQVEAFREAGYEPSRAEKDASRLRENAGVSARIAELQAKAAEKLDITKEFVTRRLVKVLDDPKCPHGVQVSATHELCDIHGLHAPTKVDTTVRPASTVIVEMPPERIREFEERERARLAKLPKPPTSE